MSGSQCAACDEVPMCAGRSPVSVSSVSECDRFRAVAAEHATLFATFAGNEGGDVSSNASSSNASDVSSSDSGSSSSSSIRIASGSNVSNPECYDSLAYFFCAQHPIEDETQATPPRASSCSNHQRPLSGHLHKCYGFCEPLLRACGSDAHSVREHCLTECRQNHGGSMCSVLRIDGVPTSYIDRLQDINGKFGLSLEAQQPVFRNGRPLYRSIPSRRSDGSSRIDYFLYSTRARGFDEWILDQDGVEAGGAEAGGAVGFVASSDLHPDSITSRWLLGEHNDAIVASQQRLPTGSSPIFSSEEITITCIDGIEESSASARVRGLGATLAPMITALTLVWWAMPRASTRARRPFVDT